MNKLIIIGNLTKDPVSRTTRNGDNVCSFTVAVNNGKKKQDGTQDADFFDVSVWGDKGINCQKFLAKGRKVCVSGPVGLNTYETQDGRHGAKLTLTGFDVEFLTPKNSVEYNQPENPVPAPQIDQQSGMQIVEGQDEDLPF